MSQELLEKYRTLITKAKEHAKDSPGKVLLGSTGGPASFALTDALFAIVEAQQKEIDELKARVGGAPYTGG